MRMPPYRSNAENEAWGEHDPAAAFAAHDPTLEPWASMTREQLMEAQAKAKTAAEFEMIQQFIEDGMSAKELESVSHAHALAVFLINQWRASGNDQARFLCDIAGRVAREIADGMPPIGPPEECN